MNEVILLVFKNLAIMFKTFNSIQFNNLFLDENMHLCKTQVLKTWPYHLGISVWLHHVTCLDQSCVRKIFDGL